MNNKYSKNLKFICIVMIIIHLSGLLYQIITKASFLAIGIKISFILMFALLLFSVLKYKKIVLLVGFLTSTIIIIISAIYMDFLSIIVAIITMLYCIKLKKNN